MKSRSAVSEKIEIEENEGINYLKFAHLEKSGSLKAGLILGHKDGTKLNPSDIPGLISMVSDISEENFKVVIPRQVHQTQVKIFKEKAKERVVRLEGDALLTDQENLFLVVQVADCLPVFLVDHEKGLIGLAHIGWRGALSGMAEKFINEALRIFNSKPEEINLVFGPSIGMCCYKVSDSLAVLVDDKYIVRQAHYPVFDSEVAQTRGEQSRRIEKKGKEKYLDLKGWVKDRFLKSGVKEENILLSKYCTFCGGKIYQSYRRDKEKAGRMVAFMGKVKERR
jgi:YfiH family protein